MSFALFAVLAPAGCRGDSVPCSLSAMDPIPCPLDATDGSGACWQRLAPVGSGAFPEDWRPGKFPLGIVPVRAFRDELWMIGQRTSWSSSDGLSWTAHAKDDWGERIGQAEAFFKDELWMFGGLDYQAL
jgi:hypothetical protein